ncbi:hypothetical protein [Paraburkholderia terrae]|uniref:hypothetical protein n=1 Tax=Paraburkholderia terrae TaxID=311230 RepID=UPI00206C22E0|nr:hypothetical protein [Paraburkholderia terrae]BDC45982.1 hypothetical protein PTKU15_92790 [Paraburkholderia terrae]
MEFAIVILLAAILLALLVIAEKLSAIAGFMQDTSNLVDGIHQEALTTKGNISTATNYLEDIARALAERETSSERGGRAQAG